MKRTLLVLGVFCCVVTFGFVMIPESKMCDNSTAGVELKTNMRKLWEDHVTWTRNVIFNIIDDLPGTDQDLKRLLKNQEDIGEAIKPYYGADASKKLTELLKTHITEAGDILKALKSGDDKMVKELSDKWTANADEISSFLAKANPAWKEEEMKKMMHTHLELTTNEAVARKKKDYEADVKAYDKVHDEILEMADMLSMGIVKHFPDKFKSTNTVGEK